MWLGPVRENGNQLLLLVGVMFLVNVAVLRHWKVKFRTKGKEKEKGENETPHLEFEKNRAKRKVGRKEQAMAYLYT